MEKNVMLYFNTEADDDNIGAQTVGVAATNCMFPAKNLVGMVPNLDGTLKVLFKSMKNQEGKNDSVILTLGANNTHLDVMKTIIRAINNTRPTFNGFVNIADDLTTIVGGAATLTPKYVTDDRQETGFISACGDITLNHETNGLITATNDGSGTGTILHGGSYRVSADSDANHIVVLPPAVIGTVVNLLCMADSTGFEVRTTAPGSIKINNVAATNAETAVPATAKWARFICIATDEWLGHMWEADGHEVEFTAHGA